MKKSHKETIQKLATKGYGIKIDNVRNNGEWQVQLWRCSDHFNQWSKVKDDKKTPTFETLDEALSYILDWDYVQELIK